MVFFSGSHGERAGNGSESGVAIKKHPDVFGVFGKNTRNQRVVIGWYARSGWPV